MGEPVSVLEALDQIECVDPSLRMALEHAVFVPPNRLVFSPSYRTSSETGTSARAKQVIDGLSLDLDVSVGDAEGPTVAEELSASRQKSFEDAAKIVMANQVVAAALRIFNGSQLVRIVR